MIDSVFNAANPLRTYIHYVIKDPIACIAALWGVCIVMPVGTQYLCLFLLLSLMMIKGRGQDVIKLFRQQRFWAISVGLFVGITFFTLATQDKYYPETPSNLWHGIRIVLTLIVGLSLRPNEAQIALKAAVISLCVMSIFVVLLWLGWFPKKSNFFINLVPNDGNKWISFSILLAMLTVACLRQLRISKPWWGLWPVALAGLALAMNLIVMNQRTAFFALVVASACLIFSLWRSRLSYLIAGIVAVAIFSVILLKTVDTVGNKFETGILEIEQARSGSVAAGSMSIRYHLYTQTTKMLLERPWLGWGIGSWNEQWKQRIDVVLQHVNMPHNDFLWMGAQSGWPGALSWLAMMLSLCWMGWRSHHAAGHIAFAVAAISLVSSLFNSGTRDASIGLPMLFVASACIAWARSRD
jgi:O-antigen ligase